jgi:ACR3 family arsenite efflux pump ArsB
MERIQVPLYLAALAIGAAIGLLVPGIAAPAEIAITPALGLLLFATFCGVPFAQIGRAFRDWRFLTTIFVVNFALVPLVVWMLSRIVAHDQVLLVGVLFVLLTPCVDYVIVFTGLAGGAKDRLLTATPLLMLAQMLLLPAYLWLFVGADFVTGLDLAPFAEAFALLIVLPLVAAGLMQAAASRTAWGRRMLRATETAMVPLMMLTLAVVVASQIAGVGTRIGSFLLTVPVYVLFAAIMILVGMGASKAAHLDAPGARAVVFSGVTRNSLVVLPLVLALPAEFALAPLVVVTQTIVELVIMVLCVRIVPRLVTAERFTR